MENLRFKIATEPEELQQIRDLNYRTFVEEIPQHSPNPDRSLVDRFEEENTYCICRYDDKVIAMIALRSKRPFSLDAKLPDLDAHLPPYKSACEIRLLAIDPEYRKGRVLTGLMTKAFEFFEMRAHDLALISGTLLQSKLYARMGFQPFGPVVGTAEAPYQPMYQLIDDFRNQINGQRGKALGELMPKTVNLLPGPVYPDPVVQAALGATPVSHRAELFEQLLGRTRQMLCRLTGTRGVAVATGTGTLANDMVAGQLSQTPGRGLILSNGEFGRRLLDHASRFKLDHETIEVPWGESFTESDIRQSLLQHPETTWLWAVHAETSTGVLNDLDMLKRVAEEQELTLCLDCVSSLGVVPCDLRGVALASGVSGKGLLSMAGLSLVFYDKAVPVSSDNLPRYLDLGLYATTSGIPFTMPSGPLTALNLALETLDADARFTTVQKDAERLCSELEKAGLTCLAAKATQFPGAITIVVPDNVSSRNLGDALASKGWLLSYESEYLIERNWVQVCLLGNSEHLDLRPLPDLLAAEVHACASK